MAERANLYYRPKQLLTFTGVFSDGSRFYIESGLLPTGADLGAAAAETARTLLADPEKFKVKP